MLALRGRDRPEDAARGGLVALGLFAGAASIVMAGLSLVEGAYCPFCVLWYGINAGIAAAAWSARDRELGLRGAIDQALGTPALVATGAFAVGLGFGMWFEGQRRAELLAEREEFMRLMIEEIRAGGRKTVELRDAPTKGSDDPEVTVIEFGDFQCPHCRKLWESIEEVSKATNRRMRVVFAHYPLETSCNPKSDKVHEHACHAAIAAECAHRQERFWEYAQTMFDNQYDLERPDLLAYAKKVGLDLGAFETCLDDPSAAAKVRADVEVGYGLDIRATPTFYVNGYELSGAMPPPLLLQVIEGLAED
jgi:protein-disulfide isomerase